ncbi:glycosyl transferase family protein [Sphingomonas sp. S-NIH.Pt15_0812]|uniref:glycosyl transferase family protein n=1 Tax=Sphingomonas sp. S-NIH.Pt15_0812 TaxID=1920129 RepID=UPI000F7E0AAE|nr:glycosyl transferase family protein [Sphingomonas sp. S-NIH.Pt15_0812]RSU46622.1 glycosyl transferase family protein [Sphingomonas sp. S-NIH.Pt15_0812]
MMDAIGALDRVLQELTLFAAVGLAMGGVDELLVDLIALWRWCASPPPSPIASERYAWGRMAVFVPAWEESEVIGAMLTTALNHYDHPDYRLYVGAYPNDPATIAAVRRVMARDDRVRLAINSRDGPTTKADCLNILWHRLLADDRETGTSTRAVVLHDAEDVVHADELRLFDALIEHWAVVQLPVVPLIRRDAGVMGALVSGTYADEFADAHRRVMPVRTFLGAAMPLAGTGCAIDPAMLARIAAARGGDPFDPVSLVEDYELGLRIAELGGRGCFVRRRDASGRLIAVRAYFPHRVADSVRQKSRWLAGIAFAGWDRTGWGRARAIGENWMRMRDRRGPLALLILLASYVALLGWGARWSLDHLIGLAAPALPDGLIAVLAVNGMLLGWRLVVRAWTTGRGYGWRQALLSAPRLFLGNYIALLAGRAGAVRYVGMLRGAAPAWGKTRHDFPAVAER